MVAMASQLVVICDSLLPNFTNKNLVALLPNLVGFVTPVGHSDD
jgi:hypothetical protein